MVSSCHVLALLLCLGSFLEAKALIKVAQFPTPQLEARAGPDSQPVTYQETRFLLHGLIEKMKNPMNLMKMVTAMAAPDPEKAAALTAATIMHNDLNSLGFRDDEVAEVLAQALEVAVQHPDTNQQLEQYTRMLQGLPLEVPEDEGEGFIQVAPAVIAAPAPTSSKTRQLPKSEAAELLHILIASVQKPENQMKLIAALHGPNPKKAAQAAAVPFMHDGLTKFGFRDDQIMEAGAQMDALPGVDKRLSILQRVVFGVPGDGLDTIRPGHGLFANGLVDPLKKNQLRSQVN